ncbi:uridine kinase [Streptomyces sp. YIM 98790]|uniref:uridine kinase family protein n=1 Tax=Streptomyces sp. YIM 98790 TaxID=2689077 RepID=UPI001A9F4C3C|nr:hypothetical protein [Streptomyces sp. YIM 98790]
MRLVAVDGPGGAGKSTFAARLAVALGTAPGAQGQAVPVVHTDDFASWDNTLDWWPRLEQQVLRPLGAGRPGRFQRYDWERRAPAEWHEVPVAGAVVLEGVSSARRAVASRLSCAVWIETGRGVRLRRGLERDGEQARPLWDAWMADEDRHFADDGTALRADVRVAGDPGPGAPPHDPDAAFVRLSPP